MALEAVSLGEGLVTCDYGGQRRGQNGVRLSEVVKAPSGPCAGSWGCGRNKTDKVEG